MASHSKNPHWEAQNFSSTPNQSDEWKSSYTRAINFLEGLNIDAEEENLSHKGWNQLKMMSKDEDWQALIETGTITPENQKTAQHILDAITTTIKSEQHFWHFWDKLLLNVFQQPDDGINFL